MTEPSASDLYAGLRGLTEARIGLGRVGQGLPTAPLLAFQLAHARAKDAVDAALDVSTLTRELKRPVTVVESAAPDRASYLQNPDFGRSVREGTEGLERGDHELAIVIADGLSATAAHAHAAAVVTKLIEVLGDWRIAPLILARQARVALGDEIGERLGAAAVVMLIGERPGLSAADSLGAYITWQPQRGRRDSERNCVSNIRSPGGLPPDRAAEKIGWLLREARKLGLTGVNLKDRHGTEQLVRATSLQR